MAAYEIGFSDNVFMLGGGVMEQNHSPEQEVAQLPQEENEELATVHHLSEAILRNTVNQEALDTLAEVVDLEVARNAINEAYGIKPLADTLQLLPTGTATELFPTPKIAETAPAPQLVDKNYVPTHEAVITKHQLKERAVTREDIAQLVEVDMIAFANVYKDYELKGDALRADLIEKFTGRFDMVGGDWMRLVERDGIIAGFMTCCPTSKTPEDFESWEKTTDNGTLESTYDPDGENVYVVSLSMLPGVGEAARNMLFTNQIGKLIEGGRKRAFFESRLPGLGAWAQRECKESGRDYENLTKDEQMELAERYFHSTKTNSKGKEVPLDRLIRIYDGAGCRFTRVVADAYDDAQSMNFGAVGIFENPLPESLQKNLFARKVVGKTVQAVAKSRWLMSKAF